jgi:uncharacterized membrane protein
MAHAEGSVTIERPIHSVFNFILDGMNNPHWRPAVTDIQRVPGKPNAIGAVFKQGMKGPGGRRIDGDYEITDCKTNETIKFKVIAGPARPTGSYQFEAVGGSTRVIFILDFQPKGFAWFMNSMINTSMQSEIDTLSNLKTYLESQPQ